MNQLWRSRKNVKTDPVFIGEQHFKHVETQLFMYNENEYSIVENPDFHSMTINDPGYINWLNFHGIHDVSLVENICKRFDFDGLVIHDILNTNQRPKLKDYEKYLFLTVKSVLPSTEKGLLVEQISFVFGEDYLVSFQEMKQDHFEHIRHRIKEKRGKVRLKGADFLLYLLLESIIDNYFQSIYNLWPKVEKLISLDQSESEDDTIVHIEAARKTLHLMKKSILPFKEVILNLTRWETNLIADRTQKYYIDLKDNCFNVLDEIDFMLQQLEGALNLHFSFQSHRMNEVMKTLTLVSAIFIPLTFIAGIYGMNFDYIPELKYKSGYFITIGSMFALSIGIVFYFKQKKWF